MRQLQIHWRPRHITDETVAALASALAQHPGEDDVVVVAYSERIRLDVRTDSTSRPALRAVREALRPAVACVLPVDTVDAF